ncbi:branched-chain amino acid ABC transporter permease [Halobacteriales archaeon SW_10_68_16]|jgi:branched-subunit amino acid ABC-type transport system permease component|nr:MAG: branched-chain amino acid ABC transporter permease [Halobacteriales archaeon SW_10_68_16]
MVPDLSGFFQAVAFGLVEASVISVGAVGLTLSYGVTRFINFAYGEFLAYGAFLAFFLSGAGLGLVPLPVAAVVAVLFVGGLGVVVSRVFFRPISDRGALPLLITSIGVAFILRYLLIASVGADARQLPVPLMRPVEVAGVGLTPLELGVVGVAVVMMLAIHLLLQWTMLGKTMRATSGNPSLAEVAGIDTAAVIRKTWFISAAAGGLAGILYGVLFAPFRPTFGFGYLIVIFAATLLGGIGRPYGAMLGAVLIGLMVSLGSTYLSASYDQAYAFLALVAVLLVRPEGIRGGEF